MGGNSAAERRFDALYMAIRDGAPVDRQAASDTAMSEPEDSPLHDVARELAEASVAADDDDELRLALAVAAFLYARAYEPGFEPWFARLERALEAVRADLRATGLTGEVRLVRRRWTPCVGVETWKGDQGWTGGIYSADAADDLCALVAVAEQASQAIMESLDYQTTGARWPACPAHGRLTSPTARHGTAAWWCDGDDGHAAAEIGHWAARQQSRLSRLTGLAGSPGVSWVFPPVRRGPA
jgi:hypothetical protein